MVGSEVFLKKSKHQFIYPSEENMFMVPDHEKKGDYYVNLRFPINRWNLILKYSGKWSFSYETEASIHLSQRREYVYSA